MAEKALRTLPVITSSTACVAAPTARSAASRVPGDMLVSASMLHKPLARRGRDDRLDVRLRMGERDRLRLGAQRLLTDEAREALVFQRALDGANAVRPLGVSHRHLMSERSRVAKKEGRHVDTLPPAATAYGVDVRTFPR